MQFLPEHFLISEEFSEILSENCVGVRVNCLLCLCDCNQTGTHRFVEATNIKFNENPSDGGQVIICGQTDTRQLIVSLRNFAKAPKSRTAITQTLCILLHGGLQYKSENHAQNMLLYG